VRHADRLNLIQLAQELTRLSELARERKLGVAELSGSTFTITNFGSYGSRLGTPIINPPEVAILGTGRIEEMPLAVDGQILIRPAPAGTQLRPPPDRWGSCRTVCAETQDPPVRP
jgi:pyruvate/2-oxoglutarate dehydrogenase complex dihydrolipoamide acyltransferase (E2) component